MCKLISFNRQTFLDSRDLKVVKYQKKRSEITTYGSGRCKTAHV